MKKQFICGLFSLSLIFLALPRVSSQNEAFDSLANEVYRLAVYQQSKSLALLEKLYQMAYHDPDSNVLIARCLYEEASLYSAQGITDTLLSNRIKSRLDRSKELPSLEHALLMSAWGISLTFKGKYAESFPLHLQALEIYKQLQDNRFIAGTFRALGRICFRMNLYNLSVYYLSEALTYVTPDFCGYYFIKADIATANLIMDTSAAGMNSSFELLKIAEENNIEELLPRLYVNIGARLFTSDIEEAFVYINKTKSLDFDNPKLSATLSANFGHYYRQKKEYSKALAYFKEAKIVMEKVNNPFNLFVLYDDLSSIFEETGQLDSALFYSRKSIELSRKLNSGLEAIEAYQEYMTIFLKTKENELIITEQTIQLKNNQVIIITIVSVFSVLVIFLFSLYTHQQKLRKASENQELASKLEHEKKLQQYEKRQRKLEQEKQKEVIDAKTREVTSYSILVSNKNQMLKQIKDLTGEIFDNKENCTKVAKKIDEIIQSNLNIDEEWGNFKMHFDKVHPDFFEKLRHICDNLTEENLKMCAYLKMRMTTKQIAQLLQVVPNSIITSRYRLRKKLQLADNEDLDSFIGNL